MKSTPTNGDNAQKKRGKNILNNVLGTIFPVIEDIESFFHSILINTLKDSFINKNSAG